MSGGEWCLAEVLEYVAPGDTGVQNPMPMSRLARLLSRGVGGDVVVVRECRTGDGERWFVSGGEQVAWLIWWSASSGCCSAVVRRCAALVVAQKKARGSA